MLPEKKLSFSHATLRTNYRIGNGRITQISRNIHIRDCGPSYTFRSISRTQIGTDFTLDKLIDSSEPQTHQNLEGRASLVQLECLDYVTFFVSIKRIQTNSAFESCFYFHHIIFESFESIDFTFGQDSPSLTRLAPLFRPMEPSMTIEPATDLPLLTRNT